MAGALSGLAESLSNLMSRHRLATFLITAAILLFWADAIRRVLPESGEVNAVTWCAVALMATAPIAVVVWLRGAPEETRFFLAWAAAQIPALLGMAAALTGSPTIVMWLGVLFAIGLLGFVSQATRAGPNEDA
jgi:hypothetical protein